MKPSTRFVLTVIASIVAIAIAIELLPFILGLLAVYYVYTRYFKKEEL